MQRPANTVIGSGDQVPSGPQTLRAQAATAVHPDRRRSIALLKHPQSSFEGVLLTIVGILLLAHALVSTWTPPTRFFFLVLVLLVFNLACPVVERRLETVIRCPFFPSIMVNLLLITALMYVTADSFPRLGLNLSLVYLFLALSAAISLRPRQTLMLSGTILLVFGFFLFKTETIFEHLSYLVFFTLLLGALTVFSVLNASRFPRTALSANILDSDLTRREKQLVLLLAEGKANKEIAVSIGISEKTVRNTLSSVYRKLDVTSRQEAILRFM